MKKLLLAASMLTALALPAQADFLFGAQNFTGPSVDNLTLTPVVPGGNQPQNIQCIICGDNQPQQAANFGYTDFKNHGNVDSVLLASTNVPGGADINDNTIGIPYGGTFLRDYLLANGNGTLSFTIGVDVNDSNKPQSLDAFYLLNLDQHKVLSVFNTPTLVPSQNNGTGFPDYTLGTFNLTLGVDIAPGDRLFFVAKMSGLNDGPDSFFIQATPVPGPIVGAGIPGLLAACGGLFGFNYFRRKRTA